MLTWKRFETYLAKLLILALLITNIHVYPAYADSYRVVTLGADLTPEQRQNILDFFNVSESEVVVITVTNADERRLLEGQYSSDEIGTRTFSCAYVNPTNSGGINVKTANLNVVESGRIASVLSTSGVVNCEVLASAPFMVSGTGAFAGVMMAYETASGTTLDQNKVDLAIVESQTTSQLGDVVGQDGATLVVNDIKIQIIRDGVQGENQVATVVDNTLDNLNSQITQLAQNAGKQGDAVINQDLRNDLCEYGVKLGQMNYNYDDMKVTLQRVTNNIVEENGIQDPITETFEDLSEYDVLPENSILRTTNDEVMGEDANITATNQEALPGVHKAETALSSDEIVTGVQLEKVQEMEDVYMALSNAYLVVKRDDNNHYALADFNGNLLTEYIYDSSFNIKNGLVEARENLRNVSNTAGVLAADGSVLIPAQYAEVEIFGAHWAAGIMLSETNSMDYDYSSWSSDRKYIIDQMDLYFVSGNQAIKRASLTREEYGYIETNGEYINIEDRTGTVRTYDGSFNLLSTEATSVYNFDLVDTKKYSSYSDPDTYLYGIQDGMGNKVTAPFASYIYDEKNGYIKYTAEQSDGKSKKGLVNVRGEEILPAVFDDIYEDGYGPYSEDYETDYRYDMKGYFKIIQDDKLGYAVTGGRLTCEPKYASSAMSAYGVAAYYQNPDGSYILISADGVETRIDTEYLNVISRASGFLWEAYDDKYSILDWHGNVLLEDTGSYTVTQDGNYLTTKKDGVLSIYQINYLTSTGTYNNGAGTQSTAQPATSGTQETTIQSEALTETETAMQPETTASAGGSGETDPETLAVVLENTISAIAEVDINSSKDDLCDIFDQEVALIEPVNPGAAAIVSSAKTMVESGTGTVDNITLLLEQAVLLLRG